MATNTAPTEVNQQIAIDAAYLLLLFDAAKKCGLLNERLEVDVPRCQKLLDQGRVKGIRPRHGVIELDFFVLIYPGQR